jgi:polysaccharide transporter, PST family
MMSKFAKLTQKASPNLRRVASNFSWLLADQCVRMGTSLIVGIWVARYLGASQYGALSYAIAIVSLFNPLISLGLDQIVIQHLSQTPLARNKILGTTFCLKLLSSFVVLGLMLTMSLHIHSGDSQSSSLTMILSVCGIFQAFDAIALWFESQIQSKYVAIARSTGYLFAALSRIVLIQVQAPLISFAYVMVIEAAMFTSGLLIAAQVKKHSLEHWTFDFKTAKMLLSESYPLILSGFAIMIYLKIDQVMLKVMLDDQAVGVYAAATRISEIFYFIPLTVTSSFAPMIYAAKASSTEQYHQQTHRLLQLMSASALLTIVTLSFLTHSLILTLFGKGYAAASPVLAIHIWASLFVFWGTATSIWFVAEKLTHLALQKTLMGAFTNILLNLYFIPKYAATGAAIATVISYAISDLFSHLLYPKTRPLFLMQLRSLLFFRSQTYSSGN